MQSVQSNRITFISLFYNEYFIGLPLPKQFYYNQGEPLYIITKQRTYIEEKNTVGGTLMFKDSWQKLYHFLTKISLKKSNSVPVVALQQTQDSS